METVTCTSNLHSISRYLGNLNSISSSAFKILSFVILYNLLSITSLSSVKPKAITESRKSSMLSCKYIKQCSRHNNFYLALLSNLSLTLCLQLSSKRLTKPSTEFFIMFSSTFNFSETSTRQVI